MGCTPEPAIWSCDTGQRIPCFDSCQLTIIWNFNNKDNQGELHTCSMICNLHWCYTFCTELPLFCIVFTESCISLNESEWRKFLICIVLILLHVHATAVLAIFHSATTVTRVTQTKLTNHKALHCYYSETLSLFFRTCSKKMIH